MGHLYRALSLAAALAERGWSFIILINDYQPSQSILRDQGVPFHVVSLMENDNWEREMIRRHGITVWINDRLDTTLNHAQRVRQEGARLVTFDDRGAGASLADVHFAALCFEDEAKLMGAKVFTGVRYLALNPEIARFRRKRETDASLVVTLGGTDTYGVTLRIVMLLATRRTKVTVITGPGFKHSSELESILPAGFILKKGVSSLAQEFSFHDFAVTGGGITPFEANAAGLPCIIVANEWFEVPIGRFLQEQGGAVFAGHFSELDESVFDRHFDIKTMSEAAMQAVTFDGLDNVCRELGQLCAA
jgi:spore coat polysaccharide biosynthesis predicted glycosyltransferase SpsG